MQFVQFDRIQSVVKKKPKTRIWIRSKGYEGINYPFKSEKIMVIVIVIVMCAFHDLMVFFEVFLHSSIKERS